MIYIKFAIDKHNLFGCNQLPKNQTANIFTHYTDSHYFDLVVTCDVCTGSANPTKGNWSILTNTIPGQGSCDSCGGWDKPSMKKTHTLKC